MIRGWTVRKEKNLEKEKRENGEDDRSREGGHRKTELKLGGQSAGAQEGWEGRGWKEVWISSKLHVCLKLSNNKKKTDCLRCHRKRRVSRKLTFLQTTRTPTGLHLPQAESYPNSNNSLGQNIHQPTSRHEAFPFTYSQ